MGKKKNRSKKSSGVSAPTVPKSEGSGDVVPIPVKCELDTPVMPSEARSGTDSCPLSNKKANGHVKASSNRNKGAQSCSKDAKSKEDQAAFLSQVKSALDKKPEVIEKITEKVVEDPKLKKMVAELQEEKSSLLKKIGSLEKEKETAVLELRKEKEESASASSPPSSASNASPLDEDSKRRLSQLEDENKGLNEKVVHYQEVLANTESLLKSLQISVENEEAVWQTKLTESDSSVKELTTENTRLLKQLEELQASMDKVKKAEEMEHQLVTLKEKLTKEEQERKSIETKLQKEEQVKVVLQEQLNNAQEQIKINAVPQVVSNANGPANGLEDQENPSLQTQ